MFAGCFSWCRLHMPWGAKKEGTETKLPEVSANLCCPISLTHCCIQNLESTLAVVPATMFSENDTGPKPSEVSRGVHVLRSLSDINDLEIAWKLAEHRANKDSLRRVHRERDSNPVSICGFNDPSSVPEGGHWSCTEDYSSMRGSLNPTFEHCKMIKQIFIRRHRMLNKNSRSC